MDGTVNWASREDGRVVRTGTREPACSTWAASGAAAAAAGLAVVFGTAAALAVAFAAALGAAGASALFAAVGVALMAPLDLLVSAFTSWSPRNTGGPQLLSQPRAGGKPSGVLPGRDCIDLGGCKRKRCRYNTNPWSYPDRQRTKETHTRLCSRPWRKMSLGRSMPIKTILLVRASPSAHCGPRSLPMSWCTPWKITLRSVPFILSTPL